MSRLSVNALKIAGNLFHIRSDALQAKSSVGTVVPTELFWGSAI